MMKVTTPKIRYAFSDFFSVHLQSTVRCGFANGKTVEQNFLFIKR